MYNWFTRGVLTFKELSACWEEGQGTTPGRLEGVRAELNEDTEEWVSILTWDEIREAFRLRAVVKHLADSEREMVNTLSYNKQRLLCKLQPGEETLWSLSTTLGLTGTLNNHPLGLFPPRGHTTTHAWCIRLLCRLEGEPLGWAYMDQGVQARLRGWETVDKLFGLLFSHLQSEH